MFLSWKGVEETGVDLLWFDSHLRNERRKVHWVLPVWSPISQQGALGGVGGHRELAGGKKTWVGLLNPVFCYNGALEGVGDYLRNERRGVNWGYIEELVPKTGLRFDI